MRNEIVALSTDTDILSLDIDGLYLTAADLKALAKGHYYFGKRIRADEKKTRKFLADLEKFRRNLECLVLKTRSYIEKVRRFKSY